MSLAAFFENFEVLAEAPNGVQKLRELILQLAVQGKLVPQDPEDEPAEVLLRRIRESVVGKNRKSREIEREPLNSRSKPFEVPDIAPQSLPSTPTVDPQLAPSPKYGAMVAVPGWGQSRHKYSGKDFKIIDDEAIECPAGHQMDRQEVRYNWVGDMQLVFGIKATICRTCPVIQHCHADRSTNTRGRRILVTRAKLPTPPPLAEVPEIIVKQSLSALNVGTQAIIWTDIPATQFRRTLKCNLERNQLQIEAVSAHRLTLDSSKPLLTRQQRAHRRLSWDQRLKRNQLQGKAVNWKVQFFGVSASLAEFLICSHTVSFQRS